MAKAPHPVIDADGHVSEGKIDWVARVSESMRESAPVFIDETHVLVEGGVLPRSQDFLGPQNHGRIEVTKPARYWSHRDGEWDPNLRLIDMDEEGIDTAVLFGARISLITLSGIQNPALAVEVARAYNDWLITEYCAADSGRLKAVSALPLQDPAAAAAEIIRTVDQGVAGAQVFPQIHRVPLHDERFDPVWRAAEESGLPVCVHIVNTKGSASDLFPTLALKHTFIPIDLMCSVASFCAAGILDRFPNLRVGFFEGGCGWLPWLSSSLDAHVDLLRTQFPWLTRRPSEWIKSQNVSFGIESDDPFLPFAMQEIGTERFMYCSDYAHWDCECPETVSELLSRDDLTDKDKEALACGNASAFFGFDAGQKS